MISRKFLILLPPFFLLWISLIIYLFMDGSNSIIFWCITLSTAFLLIFQINCATDKNEFGIIYAEIIVLFVALQLISIANAGMQNLYWLDSGYELLSTENIIQNNWNPNILGTVSPYPAIHFFVIALSQVTGTEIVNLARWMGLLMHGMALLFYLMLGKRLFENDKVSLLSGLSFIYLYYYVMVTGFGRMPLSMALFFLILYLIVRNAGISKPKFVALSILSVFTLLFAHPLAPVVLAAFLSFYIVAYYCLMYCNKTFSLKLLSTLNRVQIENIRFTSTNFILLLLICIATYFVYISVWSQGLLSSTLAILSHHQVGQSIGSGSGTPLNWKIFLYGQGIMGLIFGFLVLKSQKAMKNFDVLFLVAFSGFLVFWSLITYYLKIELLRFTLFIWPLMLLAASYAIVNLKHKNALSYLMLGFIIINIFGYYPDVYNNMEEPRYSMGEWRQYLTEQEKISVLNFDTYGKVVGNHYFNMAFLSLKNKQINVDSSFHTEGFRNPNNYSFFYFEETDKKCIFTRGVGNDNLKVSKKLYLDYQKTTSLSKVYANGEVDIYKVFSL